MAMSFITSQCNFPLESVPEFMILKSYLKFHEYISIVIMFYTSSFNKASLLVSLVNRKKTDKTQFLSVYVYVWVLNS